MMVWLGPLLGMLVSGAVTMLVYFDGKRTKAKLKTIADEQASASTLADRYGDIVDASNETSKQVIELLRNEVSRLDAQVQTLREQALKSDVENIELRRMILQLEQTVARMRSLLIQHGIAVPSTGAPSEVDST